MRAVEFTIELKGEPVVRIPAAAAAELPTAGVAREIILTGEGSDDAEWRRGAYGRFLRDDASEEALYSE